MDAGKRQLSDILNGNRLLEVPFFQRGYVWGEEQWDRLLEDMEYVTGSGHPYFIGAIILKQQETPTGSQVGDIRTIIDGQQRLTTLSLFFKVLSLKIGQPERFDGDFRLRNGSDLAIRHSRRDIDAFKHALGMDSVSKIDSEDNISRCFNYFVDKLNPEKLDYTLIFNRLLFVGIDLGRDEDEQQIFDTINSLGVRLTTAELLKNYFFGRQNETDYRQYWEGTFEGDSDTIQYWESEITTGRIKRTLVDLFFYSYLQIKIQQAKVKTTDKLLYDKVERLFESYKHFIQTYNSETNQTDLLSEIREYAAVFRRSFDPKIVEQPVSREYGIGRLTTVMFYLDISSFTSFILYVLRNQPDQDERDRLFEAMESYIMRRMVVGAPARDNTNLSASMILNQILTKEEFVDFITERSDKLYFFPNDADLKDGFSSKALINKQAAAVLYMLESRTRDGSRQGTGLLGIDRYSLEHLMPKKWRNNWKHPDTQEEAIARDRKLLTLGNLAIITQSLNASIRDSDWPTKKHGRSGRNDGLVSYAGGIETLNEYLSLDEWNEAEIDKRANDLYEKALAAWPTIYNDTTTLIGR